MQKSTFNMKYSLTFRINRFHVPRTHTFLFTIIPSNFITHKWRIGKLIACRRFRKYISYPPFIFYHTSKSEKCAQIKYDIITKRATYLSLGCQSLERAVWYSCFKTKKSKTSGMSWYLTVNTFPVKQPSASNKANLRQHSLGGLISYWIPTTLQNSWS